MKKHHKTFCLSVLLLGISSVLLSSCSSLKATSTDEVSKETAQKIGKDSICLIIDIGKKKISTKEYPQKLMAIMSKHGIDPNNAKQAENLKTQLEALKSDSKFVEEMRNVAKNGCV
jgi:predicted component of type VI protein secretion system